MSGLEAMTDKMLRYAIATKRDSCQRARGPADLGMLADVTVADSGGTLARAIVPISDRDGLPFAVMEACSGVRGSRPAVVAIVSDFFGMFVEVRPGEPEPRRGTAAAAFQALDPEAYEGLMVCALEVASGALCCAEARYRYDDSGQPVFERARRREAPEGGAVDALRASVAPWSTGASDVR